METEIAFDGVRREEHLPFAIKNQNEAVQSLKTRQNTHVSQEDDQWRHNSQWRETNT